MRTEVLEALAAQRGSTSAAASPDGGFAFASLQVGCRLVFWNSQATNSRLLHQLRAICGTRFDAALWNVHCQQFIAKL